MRSAVLVGSALIILLAGCDQPSDWYPTQAGAIRIDAFDFFAGKIDVATAYKQHDICKSFVNQLEAESKSGISGAVEPSSTYQQLSYYYYKTNAYVEFYKDRNVAFKLTLFESPAYYREPRVGLDQQTLSDKVGNMSLGDQMSIMNAIKDAGGWLTPEQLATIIERTAGKQQFNLTDWIVGKLLDKDQQAFMACIPDREKLVERAYDSGSEKSVRDGLVGAEQTMRSFIPKSGLGRLFRG